MDNVGVEITEPVKTTRGEVEALGEQIAEQAAHLDAATHRLLTDLRSFDDAHGWYSQGARSCAAWLSWRLGWSGNRAREHVRVAQRLGSLPAIDDALRKGELSYCKVRAMTRVATPANEQLLLEDARFSTGHQLELICQKYAMVQRASEPRSPADDAERRRMTRYDLDDGMVGIRVVVHPDEAIVITEALAKVMREHGPAPTVAGRSGGPPRVTASRAEARFGMVDALVEVCEAVLRGDRPERTATEIVITVPAAALATPAAEVTATPTAGAPATTPAAPPAATPTAGLTTEATTIHTGDLADIVAARDRPVASDIAVTCVSAETSRRGVVVDGAMTCGTAAHGICASAETSRRRAVVDGAMAFGMAADGTCVSAETSRRLACDAALVIVRHDGDGNPLSVGRKTRTIHAALKRALLDRDKTCRFPGCTNRRFLDGHHIKHWADGGETCLENTLAMCRSHHRFVHEYGVRIEVDAAQRPRFFDRRGRLIAEVPSPPHLAEAGTVTIRRMNEPLAITAATNIPGWDGTPVNYSWVIEDLVRADRLT